MLFLSSTYSCQRRLKALGTAQVIYASYVMIKLIKL
jgi:hypothetical protein